MSATVDGLEFDGEYFVLMMQTMMHGKKVVRADDCSRISAFMAKFSENVPPRLMVAGDIGCAVFGKMCDQDIYGGAVTAFSSEPMSLPAIWQKLLPPPKPFSSHEPLRTFLDEEAP